IYQILTRFFKSRYSASPGLTSNALYHASRLRTVCTRYDDGACSLVMMTVRKTSSRILLRKDFANAMKNSLSVSTVGAWPFASSLHDRHQTPPSGRPDPQYFHPRFADL